jgi:hypothetical protein
MKHHTLMLFIIVIYIIYYKWILSELVCFYFISADAAEAIQRRPNSNYAT